MTPKNTIAYAGRRAARRPGHDTAVPARRVKAVAWALVVVALATFVFSSSPAAVPPLAVLLLTVLAAVGALRGVVALVDRQARRADALAARGAPRRSISPHARERTWRASDGHPARGAPRSEGACRRTPRRAVTGH